MKTIISKKELYLFMDYLILLWGIIPPFTPFFALLILIISLIRFFRLPKDSPDRQYRKRDIIISSILTVVGTVSLLTAMNFLKDGIQLM